jgi:hypothetical protein
MPRLTLNIQGKVGGLTSYAEIVVLMVPIYLLASIPLSDMILHRKKYYRSVKGQSWHFGFVFCCSSCQLWQQYEK